MSEEVETAVVVECKNESKCRQKEMYLRCPVRDATAYRCA